MTKTKWRKLADVAAELGYEVEPTPLHWPPRLPHNAFPWPEIVGHWEEQFRAQEGRCYWCREPMSRDHQNLNRYATEEHLLRKRDGGRRTPGNIVLAHGSCNRNRDRKNHLPRYDHDPFPLPRKEATQSRRSRHARRWASAHTNPSRESAAVRLPARPVAPLEQGQPAPPPAATGDEVRAQDRPA